MSPADRVGAGAAVGILDFGKGVVAVWAGREAGLSVTWQLAAGAAAVAGHDFPIWAGFFGGQGMATSLGALSLLIPLPTLIGLLAFGLVYLFTRAFDLSAGMGLGLILLTAWQQGVPIAFVVYAAGLFVSIGVKKALDRPRREALGQDVNSSPFGEAAP